MQANKSTGSKIEVKLAKALYARGYRYRKNNKKIYGKPDLTFRKIKLAIFVDGEFWHGKNWEKRKYDHKTNQEFWYKKIERNIQRDIEVNEHLKNQGWKVLRFWGNEIEKNLLSCILLVEREIRQLKLELFDESDSVSSFHEKCSIKSAYPSVQSDIFETSTVPFENYAPATFRFIDLFAGIGGFEAKV